MVVFVTGANDFGKQGGARQERFMERWQNRDSRIEGTLGGSANAHKRKSTRD